MRLSEFVYLMTKSVNPGEYKVLVTRRKREALIYFAYLLFFCIVIGFLVNLPNILTSEDYVHSRLSKLERFNITGIDIQLKEPIVLIANPKIAVDFSANSTIGDRFVMITKENIVWKEIRPDIFRFQLFDEGRMPLSEVSELVKKEWKLIYWTIFFIMIPTLLFVFYIFYFIKYVLISLAVAFIGYIVGKIKSRKFGLVKSVKVSVFSITVLLVLEVALSRLIDIGIFSLVIYLILFFICLFASGDKEMKFREKEKIEIEEE